MPQLLQNPERFKYAGDLPQISSRLLEARHPHQSDKPSNIIITTAGLTTV